jgi:adenine/guanine phosphoribosyltransferase-like PRPP-binding protein
MGRGVIAADRDGNLCSKVLKQGWRTVLFTDVLTDGQAELGLIKMIEDAGCKVLRIGFIAEDASFNARKSKVLKGYPFEAVADI